MWYILTFIGLYVVLIHPIVSYIINSHKNRLIPVNNSKIDIIIDFATLMAKHIQNNVGINSPLIFYEQIFLLYFLWDMCANINHIPDIARHKMLNDLVLTLENKHKLDYLNDKDDFKNTFLKRYENYLYIVIHDNYNFSDSFFNEVFEYQTAQVISIKNKNQFTNFNTEVNCLENTPEELKIKSYISDNKSLINAFMSQQ